MKHDHFLTPSTKINPKWIKNLNVRPEENIGNTFFIGCSSISLDMSSQAKETKAKLNYRDCTKLKTFCTVKETINKQKGKLLNGRRYLQMIYLLRD